jgi:excisionase family DNA binding protein
MKQMDSDDFLTVEEVAAWLHLPEMTVSRLLNQGKLPGIYAGNREGWRIRRTDLETWTTNQPAKEQAE